MDIKIVDDVLTPNLYHAVKHSIIERSDWHVGLNIAGNVTSEDRFNQYGFGMLIYDVPDNPNAEPIRHPSFNLFFTIYLAQLDALGLIASEHELLRIRLGLLTHQGSQVIHDPHIDFNMPHRTMLTYFTTEEGSGQTTFYKGSGAKREVMFENYPKENTCVDFNGLIYHSSSTPLKSPVRYAMNINYRKIL